MPYYVYLITEKPFPDEVVRNWVKIGYSENPPEWRMNANLKRGNPRALLVASAFEYRSKRDALAAEKAAHIRFEKHSHEKEWFNIRWQTVDRWFRDQGATKRKNGNYRKTRPR